MPTPYPSLSGKVCLITGATSGIGEVAARSLAQLGAAVVLVGRSAQRGAAALDRIRQASPNPSVSLLLADLSDQAQVRQLARDFADRHARLDLLINNAGALFLRRRESVDGLEMTFALNHLNYFLLTHLLLDTLKASAPARVVNVSSRAHRRVGGMRWDDLQFRRAYDAMGAYAHSKLANLLFTAELARRLDGTGVTTNAMHPGFVATRFGKNNGWLARLVLSVLHLRARTPAEGAETITFLAASPDVEGVSGKYFVDNQIAVSSAASQDAAAAERLWQISASLTGLPAPT